MKYKPELHKLSNGVPVIFDPMDLEAVDFRIVFFTGSRDEKPSEYGITHFCEHMFCKGSKRFPNYKDRREYLADMGCVSNASTCDKRLSFYGECVADNLDVLIDCIGEQLQNPLFDADTIEHERGPILDELRRSEDTEKNKDIYFIYKKLFNSDYDHTLGTVENINSFTRKQLLFFIRRRMSSDNCVIVISGKIRNKEKTLAQLEKSFGFLKPFNVKENEKMEYTPHCAHKTRTKNSNVRIRIMFPVLWPEGDEYKFQRMCVNKFKQILLEKLADKLRMEHGLVYSVSGQGYGDRGCRLFGIDTQTAPDNVAKCVALIAQTCADIYYNNSFSSQDIERVTKRFALGDAKYLDSPKERADNLIGRYHYHKDLYDFYGVVKMGHSIKRDDIIKNIRGIFDGKMSIITSGPKFDGDLMKIWRDNFKPDNTNSMTVVKKNKKTR